MKFHIIIPVFNNKSVTLEFLGLFSHQTFKDFAIYVVDDGSSDGTSYAVQMKHPTVTVLHGNGNLWWAGAINKGLEHVLQRAKDGDHILTLNDDVFFEENYLENLAKAVIERPNWLIGSVSVDKHNPDNIDAGVYFEWRTRKRHKGVFIQGNNFNDYVNHISGRGALIPVKVFKEVGLYNSKRLPHYGADAELGVRAQKAGYRLCVYWNAVLQNDTAISGYKFTPFTKITYKMALHLLFSNKSVSQIKTRLNFVFLCCPKRYLLRNILAELFNILLIITSVSPIFEVKVLFRPFLKKYLN